MAGIDLAMRASIQGFEKLVRLNTELFKTRTTVKDINVVKQIARKQADLSIANMKEENRLLKEQNKLSVNRRIQMAKGRIEQRQLLEQRELNNEIDERAVGLVKRNVMTKNQAIKLAEQEIRLERVSAIATRARNELRKEELRLAGLMRQELMQASIGMFVMGITATQTTSVLRDMAGANTARGMTFNEMTNGIRFMLGPIQVVTAALQFMNMQNKALMFTMSKYVVILAMAYFWFKAITVQSRAVKVAMVAIASGITILTAAMWKYNLSQLAVAFSSVAKWVGVSGPILGPVVGAVLVGAIAAAVGATIAAVATIPRGQTTDGYIRPIRETGLFYGHRGEGVGQIGAMVPSAGGRGNVYITIESGVVVDEPLITKLSRSIEIANASGGGS